MKNEIDIEIIKKLNKDKGFYFFSPDTMRFFSSRVSGVAYKNEDNTIAYFVTSERYGDQSRRLYTVRACNLKEGDISSPLFRYNVYKTLNGAIRRAKVEAGIPVNFKWYAGRYWDQNNPDPFNAQAIIFKDLPENVNPINYPDIAFCWGGYKTKREAIRVARYQGFTPIIR